ncbi:MAG: hypothetical protein MUF14_02015 [Hyphomonadaceae bacterium]|jgi:uncharacterized FlaG/YvyC family protein|nr:hypothetical protein [Hyphomonadaceae bacterium]
MSMEVTTQAVPSVIIANVAASSQTEPEAQEANPAPEPAPVAASQTTTTQAEDAAVARKRIELAERLVGANKSLVIEKDPVRSGFIYKTVDRQTGQVTRVWPQEEAASALRALADVDARGAMINTRV